MGSIRRPDDRLAVLEREHAERLARVHAELAAAQDRAYWLERWGLDLNALMSRRGAEELRAVLRALRDVRRRAIRARRSLDDRLARRRAGKAATAPASSATLFERGTPPDRLRTAVVTDLLYGRLDAADVAAVEAAADAAEARALDAAGEMDRCRLIVSLGVHHGVPGVLAKTGLTQATPPAQVHTMARGTAGAGAPLYYADLVLDGLAAAGIEPREGLSVLDFGCSSGRVVRVLAAAHPECEWHGCDPIPAAIEWARANLPGVHWENSPERPPLRYADGSFDAVYAISIWSHFAAPAAVAWLHEMRRMIRPGGALLLTTHGHQSVAYARGVGLRQAGQLAEIMRALDRDGFWFKAEFGADGDHGVEDLDWGTAFFTAEWLLAAATPEWRVAAFAPGRVELNQDLYVLVRT